MSQITRNSLTEHNFFALVAGLEGRWELIDGELVMMAPTTQRHANIVANVLATLHGQLRGTGYRPTCSGPSVRTGIGTIRYPDLVVDCGHRHDHEMCATTPVVVCEVLSSSRDQFDTHLRVLEYRAVPDIACILLIDPDEPRAILHRRDDAGWCDHLSIGLDQVVDITEVGATVPLRDVYDGLEFTQPDDTLRGHLC
ncbi:Uma2 family endonuclease [Phaeovulum veldkampii]|nr:Uma2 family endonuclease [Phaeovulum veldkampii]TDQ54583.1 Uma2 family endonuclease [Phaeovulum veldkampii DSM 11550]